VQEVAREQHKMVLLATTGGTPADEKDAVAAFAARRADAIVIAGSRSRRPEDEKGNADLAAELDRYCRNGGHVGVVGQAIVGAGALDGYHLVEVPNAELAAELAGKLAGSHSGEFVIIGGPEGLITSDDRIRGFQSGLAAAGRSPAEVLRASFNRAGGYEAGLELARRIRDARASGASGASKEGEKPGLCIFAANDVMAIGATAGLRSQGFRIPRDALIAGFDDIETLRDFRPGLSTVRLPLEEIGRLATLSTSGSEGPDGDGHHDGGAAVTGQVTLRRSTEWTP
jgi:LacI family transcriptional regulator